MEAPPPHYFFSFQLGQLERLRFCLSKFCIPGLGEFLACEESLSPSKEGVSPSNVSESESQADFFFIKFRDISNPRFCLIPINTLFCLPPSLLGDRDSSQAKNSPRGAEIVRVKAT